ncbi:hypothetical protein V1264_002908 [Littorina saxatilis]|uniref:PDZ domain-containing protein n=1 Tax=Littorina saxatilis TaxID=31220 RepID=A0AAN9G9D8_9CAEN
MMERKFAKFFHRLVHEIIPDNGQRDSLFEALRRYQSSQKLHQLLVDLRELLDEPQKLELYEFIRPLILLRHQMEYSYLAPAIPGVRLRTIRLRRAPGQSLGFAVRGGYEFSVGVFVSAVEPGSQAEKQGLRVGDEIVRVNGFTIAEAIHDDVLNLIKSREEIVLKVTHIGMLPIKEHASDTVTWRYVEDMNSKKALNEVLAEKQVNRGRGMELKIFIDCTGYDSIGCGILSGPPHYPGIFVEKVRIGSLAQDVGLEVGDQIVEVNETSFLNIGHKEAVVVLKGSKQLNVIIRKHAGLPLFEQRKTPSRVSASSSSSTRPARSRSPPVSTQRSTQNTVDRTELDETQLIEQQLGRTAPFRSHTSMSSPPRDSQAGDQVLISTQAEVHSDSDSISGSVGEGARIPVEEPALANHPATPPSFPPVVPSLMITDDLGNARNIPSSPPPPLPAPPPLNLPDDLGNTDLDTSSTFTPLDDGNCGDDPSHLPLPDDLGDPVLAALHLSAYPPDSPPWVLPYSRVDPPDVSTLEIDVPNKTHSGGLYENALDLNKGPGTVGAVSGNFLVYHHISHTERTNTVSFSCGTFDSSVVTVGGMAEREVGVTDEEGRGESSSQGVTEAPAERDENSNFVQKAKVSSEFETGFTRGLSSESNESNGKQQDSADSWGRRSTPPVFVPPPPPSFPPSPPPQPSDFLLGGQKRLSISSQLSTASTQTQKSGNRANEEDGVFSELGGWSPSLAGASGCSPPDGVGVFEVGRGRGSWEDDGVSLNEGGINLEVHVDVHPSPVPDYFSGDTTEDAWKLAEPFDLSDAGHVRDGETGLDGSGLSDVDFIRSRLSGAGDDVAVHDHDLPPPPDSFFEEEHDHEQDTEIPSVMSEVPSVMSEIPSMMSYFHDDTSTPPERPNSTDTRDTIPTEFTPYTPPPPNVLPPPPPPPPPPVPLVLGGAAAFLAVRREARKAERIPRLLVAAEQGFSSDALGGAHVTHERLAPLPNTLELDGRELRSFVFPKNQKLGIEMEGGMGTPLAGRIVVAAVFEDGAAMEKGLETGDQLMMINGRKLTDVTVAQAEQILDQAEHGPKDQIQVVYTHSSFLNDQECVTYF